MKHPLLAPALLLPLLAACSDNAPDVGGDGMPSAAKTAVDARMAKDWTKCGDDTYVAGADISPGVGIARHPVIIYRVAKISSVEAKQNKSDTGWIGSVTFKGQHIENGSRRWTEWRPANIEYMVLELSKGGYDVVQLGNWMEMRGGRPVQADCNILEGLPATP